MDKDFLQYVGFMLTTGLSLVLSILLFTSVADSRLYFAILMGIASATELGKVITINEGSRLIARLLIVVSVLGSAGGLNRAVMMADGSGADVRIERQVLQAQVDQTLLAIEQNNESIAFYRARNEVRGMVLPLQEENRQLQQDLDGLQLKLVDIQPVDVPELVAVLNLLATVLAMPLEWVRAFVILLLAGLLDALTVSFIRCGVLERLTQVEDFQPDPQDKMALPQETIEEVSEPVIAKPAATADNVTAMDDSYPSFRRMMVARRERGEPVLSQRACIRELDLKDRTVRGYFHRLQSEGVIEKRGGVFEFAAPQQKAMRLV